MATCRQKGTPTSRAGSATDMVAVQATDPPHWRLSFWFLGLVFTGDGRAFRRLLILLLFMLAAMISLALAAGPWAGPGVLALDGSLVIGHAAHRWRHAGGLPTTAGHGGEAGDLRVYAVAGRGGRSGEVGGESAVAGDSAEPFVVIAGGNASGRHTDHLLTCEKEAKR